MIKVTLGEVKTQQVKPFPKLMIGKKGSYYEGGIVLFFQSGVGTNILPGGAVNACGDHATNYNMQYFTDYNEPITIQNA